MPGYPLINGNEHSFASVVVRAGGKKYYPTAVDYDDALEPGSVEKSGSAIPAGTTRGKWSGTASMEMTLVDGQAYIDALGDQFGLAVQSAQIIYEEAVTGVVKHELPAFRVKHVTNMPGSGSDPAKMKFDLHLMKPILRNGKAIIADTPATI